tara:strand:+ start:21472 stop:22170 length:699 start_codon:yes stop_codon:yes gene_type:complete
MLVKEAIEHTGSLGQTWKMPGKSIGIQAKYCNVGSKLAKVEDTVCSKCYGLWGFYMMPNVKKSEDLRLDRMMNDPMWEPSMVFQLNRLVEPYFRWFDNGDIPDLKVFRRIVRVCEHTPSINHWLPTKEYGVVNDFLLEGGKIPENLSLRPSGYKFNGEPPEFKNKFHLMSELPTSTATYLDENDKPEVVHGHLCPAHWNKGQCGDCRACWNKEVSNVTYVNQRQKIKETNNA